MVFQSGFSRSATWRSPKAASFRAVPLGEGFVPLADHVRTVASAFPAIPIELELFADQLPGRCMEEILSSSAAALSTLVEE